MFNNDSVFLIRKPCPTLPHKDPMSVLIPSLKIVLDLDLSYDSFHFYVKIKEQKQSNKTD